MKAFDDLDRALRAHGSEVEGQGAAMSDEQRSASASQTSETVQKDLSEMKDGDVALEWLSDFGKVYEDSGREGYDLCTTDVERLIASVRAALNKSADSQEIAPSGRELKLLRASRNIFMSNRIHPEKIEALRVAVNLYAQPGPGPMAGPCARPADCSGPGGPFCSCPSCWGRRTSDASQTSQESQKVMREMKRCPNVYGGYRRCIEKDGHAGACVSGSDEMWKRAVERERLVSGEARRGPIGDGEAPLVGYARAAASRMAIASHALTADVDAVADALDELERRLRSEAARRTDECPWCHGVLACRTCEQTPSADAAPRTAEDQPDPASVADCRYCLRDIACQTHASRRESPQPQPPANEKKTLADADERMAQVVDRIFPPAAPNASKALCRRAGCGHPIGTHHPMGCTLCPEGSRCFVFAEVYAAGPTPCATCEDIRAGRILYCREHGAAPSSGLAREELECLRRVRGAAQRAVDAYADLPTSQKPGWWFDVTEALALPFTRPAQGEKP